MNPARYRRLSTGLRTCRLASTPTCRRFPARLVQASAFACGFRSCLPLRDSPGFPPGSLIDNAWSLAHKRFHATAYRYTIRFQTLASLLQHRTQVKWCARIASEGALKRMTFCIAQFIHLTAGGIAVHTYFPMDHSDGSSMT